MCAAAEGWRAAAGYEKILRLYDVERPDAAPAEIRGAPDKVLNAGPGLRLRSLRIGLEVAGWRAQRCEKDCTVRVAAGRVLSFSVPLTHPGLQLRRAAA